LPPSSSSPPSSSPPPVGPLRPLAGEAALWEAAALVKKKRQVRLSVDRDGVRYLPQLVACMPNLTILRLSCDVPAWTIGVLASLLPRGLPHLKLITLRSFLTFESDRAEPPAPEVGSFPSIDVASYLDLARAAASRRSASLSSSAAGSRLVEVRLSPTYPADALRFLVQRLKERVPESKVRWVLPENGDDEAFEFKDDDDDDDDDDDSDSDSSLLCAHV
jgi:hypothetical protein